VWLSLSIYYQIKHQNDVHQSWQMIKAAFYGTSNWKIVIVIMLMLLNYGIESRKWQILINRIEDIGLWNAFKATLTGQAFALNTINAGGDIIGRILYLQEGNRLRAIALSLVGSMSQILVIYSIGLGALTGLRFTILEQFNHLQGLNQFWLDLLLITLFIGVFVYTIFYFNVPLFIRLIEKIPFVAKYKYFIEKLEAHRFEHLL
jgi:uncharacterized membrane protein YbhN (UPF0104 family)